MLEEPNNLITVQPAHERQNTMLINERCIEALPLFRRHRSLSTVPRKEECTISGDLGTSACLSSSRW